MSMHLDYIESIVYHKAHLLSDQLPAPHSALLSLPDLSKLAFSRMDGSVRRAGGGGFGEDGEH